MFGLKKRPSAQFTSLNEQAGSEPVHIFDQTNGVLKHFEERNDPQPADAALRHTAAGPMAAASLTSPGHY